MSADGSGRPLEPAETKESFVSNATKVGELGGAKIYDATGISCSTPMLYSLEATPNKKAVLVGVTVSGDFSKAIKGISAAGREDASAAVSEVAAAEVCDQWMIIEGQWTMAAELVILEGSSYYS
eukprot:Skav213021  [mRNA]  locus=scaffold2312:277576:282163:+ [translate_table: standard]